MTKILKSYLTSTEARVYVACLASYNAGKLVGKWLPATDVDELRQGIAEMLESSPEPGAEEWAVHDYDGGLGRVFKTESPDLEDLCAFGEALQSVDDAAAFLAWAEYSSGYELDGLDASELEQRFEDQYRGEWDSEKDFAEDYVEQVGDLSLIPENLRSYFDYEAYARDLFMDLTSVDRPGGVYVFDFNA